jgi:ABC-type transport system involved in multi-copper enzyme maturation permease subunit
MIRLTWRQFRTQVIVVAGLFTVIAVVLIVTGVHLSNLYRSSVVACTSNCDSAKTAFQLNDHFLQGAVIGISLVAPALFGMFWGAPLLAREIETGTYRLALTQSVTRRRWFISKFAAAGLASMLAVGLLSLLVTWWSSPFVAAGLNRFDSSTFGLFGLAPVGYAAFAFSVAAVAGLVVRRTVPAMALSLAVLVAARLAVTFVLRARFLAPSRLFTSLNPLKALGFNDGPSGIQFVPGSPSLPHSWVLSTSLVDQAGHVVSDQANHQFLVQHCPSLVYNATNPKAPGKGPDFQGMFQSCVHQLGSSFHAMTTYQPASHFWPLQWIEMGVFVAAALAIGALGLWWTRRRLS